MKTFLILIPFIFFGACATQEAKLEFRSANGEVLEMTNDQLQSEFSIAEVSAKTLVVGGLSKAIDVYLVDPNNLEINYEAFNFRLVYAKQTYDCLRVSKCRIVLNTVPDNAADPTLSNELLVFVDIAGVSDANIGRRYKFNVPNSSVFYYNWVVKRDRTIAFSRPQLSSVIKGLILTKGYVFNYAEASEGDAFVELPYVTETLKTIWLPRSSLEIVRAK